MLWSNPRTVATSALAVRRSNHYARSHPRENCKPFLQCEVNTQEGKWDKCRHFIVHSSLQVCNISRRRASANGEGWTESDCIVWMNVLKKIINFKKSGIVPPNPLKKNISIFTLCFFFNGTRFARFHFRAQKKSRFQGLPLPMPS